MIMWKIKLLLITLITLSMLNSNASNTENLTTTPSTSQKADILFNGFKLDLMVSPGINIVNPSNSYKLQSGSLSGVGIGFEKVNKPTTNKFLLRNLGFSANLAVFTGEFDKKTIFDTNKFSISTLNANLNYSFTNDLYGIVGLESTSFGFNQQVESLKISGLGFRVGVAYNVSQKIAINYIISKKELDIENDYFGTEVPIGTMNFTMGQFSTVIRF